MHVFVYNGEGASEFCVAETLDTFRSLGSDPQLINSNTLHILSSVKEIFIFYFAKISGYIAVVLGENKEIMRLE